MIPYKNHGPGGCCCPEQTIPPDPNTCDCHHHPYPLAVWHEIADNAAPPPALGFGTAASWTRKRRLQTGIAPRTADTWNYSYTDGDAADFLLDCECQQSSPTTIQSYVFSGSYRLAVYDPNPVESYYSNDIFWANDPFTRAGTSSGYLWMMTNQNANATIPWGVDPGRCFGATPQFWRFGPVLTFTATTEGNSKSLDGFSSIGVLLGGTTGGAHVIATDPAQPLFPTWTPSYPISTWRLVMEISAPMTGNVVVSWDIFQRTDQAVPLRFQQWQGGSSSRILTPTEIANQSMDITINYTDSFGADIDTPLTISWAAPTTPTPN